MSKVNSHKEQYLEIDSSGLIAKALKNGDISFSDDEKRISYSCSRSFSALAKNPEEKVRALVFCELIYKYQYPSALLDFEVLVPRRTPEDRADIVVYSDQKLKSPYLVVECKKDGISDDEFRQAIEQAFGNSNSIRSKYALVVAGNTRTAFDVSGFLPNERHKNVISDIPVKFGKAPKYRYIKGEKGSELVIVSREDLIRSLEKCHDTVWQGGKLDSTTAFDEVSKLLFCKFKDEKDGTKNGEPYKFQIGTHETASEVFQRIESIYTLAQKNDPDVFQDGINLDPSIVYNVAEHIQSLAMNKIDLDTKGIAFERFMQDFFKGKMGQFFTPRPVVDFCLNISKPEAFDQILDPACGSGGFLIHALDRIRKETEEGYEPEEARAYWSAFYKNNLHGIEINEKIARVCKMNMIIHEDGHTNIISTDTLQPLKSITQIHKKFKKESFDLILTNPPFGASIKRSEKPYLDDYIFGKGKKSQKSEILFLERCLEFLKKNSGRMAIVIPDNILVNKSLQDVRDFLVSKCTIEAVVSLPDFSFSHYGANVKSSILLIKNTPPDNKSKVFMASVERVGYTASGKSDDVDELPEIAKIFNEYSLNGSGIPKAWGNRIYVVLQSDLSGYRMDPKGHSPIFKQLKKDLFGGAKTTVPLHSLLLNRFSGEWGLDEYEEVETEDDYASCLVLRNVNFKNTYNIELSDVAVRQVKKDKIKTTELKLGDILIEKSGGSPVQPVGRSVYISQEVIDCSKAQKKSIGFSNFLENIRVDDSKVEASYLFAYLRTLYKTGFMEYIQNQTTGIKNLLMDEFLDIPVVRLSKKDELRIGQEYIKSLDDYKKSVSDLDEGFELNRKEIKEKIFK